MKNQTPHILGAVLTCIVAGAAGCCGMAVSAAAITVAATPLFDVVFDWHSRFQNVDG